MFQKKHLWNRARVLTSWSYRFSIKIIQIYIVSSCKLDGPCCFYLKGIYVEFLDTSKLCTSSGVMLRFITLKTSETTHQSICISFITLPHTPRGGTYCIWADKVRGIHLFLLISTGIKYNLLPWECNGLYKRQSKAALNFTDYLDSKTVITNW